MVTNQKNNTWIKNVIKHLKIYNKGCNGTQMSRFDTILVQQQIYNKSTMLVSLYLYLYSTHIISFILNIKYARGDSNTVFQNM